MKSYTLVATGGVGVPKMHTAFTAENTATAIPMARILSIAVASTKLYRFTLWDAVSAPAVALAGWSVGFEATITDEAV